MKHLCIAQSRGWKMKLRRILAVANGIASIGCFAGQTTNIDAAVEARANQNNPDRT